jgi:thiol:disulfide interchange protein
LDPPLRLPCLLLVWLTALALGLGLGATAQAQSPVQGADSPYLSGAQVSDNKSITVELVPLSRWAAPGSTTVVALKQQIAPGWHTYWRNPGDSGGATEMRWSLPTGVSAGDIIWPVPQRQRLLDLVNYGYSGTVYLPVPIQIPANGAVGRDIPLHVEADLFVCSAEMCIPHTFRLALDMAVQDGAAPAAPDAAAIRQVMEQAPRPAGITARLVQSNGVLTLSATGGPLAGADPGRVWFYPFKPGQIAHGGDQSGQRGPDGLMLVMTAGSAREAAPDAPLSGVLQTALGAFEITTEAGPTLDGVTGQPLQIAAETPAEAPTTASRSGGPGLWQAALLALLGGLILNLMPCVFPILAMKAASLAASAHEPKLARRDGLLFLFGVLAAFAVLAGALLALRAGGAAIGWGFQLQSPLVTVSLSLLMLAVGLNLSGVFHVGAGLQGLGSGPLARAPGGTGAFLTGVLAVVVAAPCTAPFMAAALGAALVMSWPAAMLVFLMLGLGLALPYLAVSLSPRLLARLPRPGAWMERLKNLLAFPMYGAALWLAWVVTRQIGDMGLAALFGAGLLLAFGLWLYGQGQNARAWGGRGRLATATAAAVLIIGLALGIVAARTPVQAAAAGSSQAASLTSAPWSPETVRAAQAEGRPVLVEFTADWCVTCKINEGTSLATARTSRTLEETNTLYLVGDWTRRDDAIAEELARHGRSGVPLYLLYPANGGAPRILPQILTEGLVVEALKDAA